MRVMAGRLFALGALLAAYAGLVSFGQPAAAATRRGPEPKPNMRAELSPVAGAAGVPVTTEVGTRISAGRLDTVILTDPQGHQIPSAERPDGTSWVPAHPLAYATRYTATVTANDNADRPTTAATSFTTMQKPGGEPIGTGLYFFDDQVYGVGLPIVVEFDAPIPDRDKSAVERRLFVTSDPPQVGVWRWYGDRQVLYRPELYWQPGTRLTVRAALGGLPVGNRYVDRDRGGTATIGNSVVFDVDNATKRMRVLVDDRVAKTFPVSLGKRSTPSASGHLVVMSKNYETLFDVPGEYRLNIFYAERLTWGGQFIHAAPWSVGSQGHRNVSHGCVNLATANAAWVYGVTHIGDPVLVSGTEAHVAPGDGWTVWDLDWPAYLSGSALLNEELHARLAAGAGRVLRIGVVEM
jgi:lipoprotein-anchoring transpeptidase ErfK/SrfK